MLPLRIEALAGSRVEGDVLDTRTACRAQREVILASGDQDVVVLTARMVGAGGPELLAASDQLFSEYEQMLFTKAVSVAESFGKHISLLVVPAGDIFAALVQNAFDRFDRFYLANHAHFDDEFHKVETASNEAKAAVAAPG